MPTTTSLAAVVDAAQTPRSSPTGGSWWLAPLGRFGAEERAPLLAYLAEPLPSTTLVLVAEGGPEAAAGSPTR